MTSDFNTLTEADVPDGDEPPNAGQSHHTIRDVAWWIDDQTADEWTVTRAGFEQPASVTTICLRLTLKHDEGATIECKPIDPWAHQPGQKVYRAHRVAVDGEPGGLPAIVTLCDDIDIPDGEGYFGHLPLDSDLVRRVVDDQSTVLELKAAGKVRQEDSTVEECMPQYGVGYTIKESSEVQAAVILASEWLADKYDHRPTFGTLEAQLAG